MATVKSLAVDKIRPDPSQPRKEFNDDELQELANSIKANGLLQPVAVRKNGSGYLLIAGERRWRAHKINGEKTIDAMVFDVDDTKAKALQLIENIVRKDLNPMEQANAYKDFIDKGGTVEQLADILGKPKNIISWQLNLTKTRPEIQNLVETGTLSMVAAISMAQLNPNNQLRAVRTMNEQGLSIAETQMFCSKLVGEESKVDMFPEVLVLTGQELKARGLAKTMLERAIQAINELTSLEDKEAGVLGRATEDCQNATIEKVDYLIKQLQSIKRKLTEHKVGALVQETAQPVEKARYEMTLRECAEADKAGMIESLEASIKAGTGDESDPEALADIKAITPDELITKEARSTHKRWVRDAIKSGADVPQKVRAEYPELAVSTPDGKIEVDTATYAQIRESYSADRIGDHRGSTIRKPFKWFEKDFINTGSHGINGQADAYQVVPLHDYPHTTTTYAGKDKTDEERRNDPKGFYNGMKVKYGKRDCVLVGPPVHFKPSRAGVQCQM